MTPLVLFHVAAASAAVPAGAAALLATKGGRLHRLAGRAWVALMLAAAGSSLFIMDVNPDRWSPLHALSVFTLVMLGWAIAAVARGDIRTHRRAMRGTYAGLVIAGAFALLPGRALGVMLWG